MIREVFPKVFQVDLKPAGLEGFISSYIVAGEKAVIVEPGPSSTAGRLLSALEELSIPPAKVAYILVTHIHVDHAGASGFLLDELPEAKLAVFHRASKHMVDPAKLWESTKQVLGERAEVYGPYKPVPPGRILEVREGDSISAGSFKLEVIESPGHAYHHICYLMPSMKALFAGDAVGVRLPKADATVPTTPPPFRLDIELKTLDKLASLAPEHLCYTHFGAYPNAVEMILGYRRQLELWYSTVREMLGREASLDDMLGELERRDPVLSRFLESYPQEFIRQLIYASLTGMIWYAVREQQ